MSHATHFLRASRLAPVATAACLLAATAAARADAVTDWSERSAKIVTEARLGTPPAVRVMALVQTAAWEAAREAAGQGAPGAVDAAIAAAHRHAFGALLPAQRASVEVAFQAALARAGGEAAHAAALAAGERAAQRVLAARADDLPKGPDATRPAAPPGAWVPTAAPAATAWPQRRPWWMARADQFRPGPPPALASERWARDYDEVKSLGAKDSRTRTPEQTSAARFWEFSLPDIYHGVLRSAAAAPGRSVADNARLFAAAAQAMDEALIAVMDAKYAYSFWRPVTAIRNGDADGQPATERDAAWQPMIETPMHPEYPSAHAVLASAVATVIAADFGPRPLPTLATASPSADGAVRRWQRLDDFVREVGEARIWEGVHFRSAVDTGTAMGRQVGALVAGRSLPGTAVAGAAGP